MAGIFGYCADKLNAKETINTFYIHAQLNFNHPSNFKIIDNGVAGMGFAAQFYNKGWPVISKCGDYYFQYFGKIYLPGDIILNEYNFDNFFLKPFLNNQNDFLLKLDGSFIFALYDKKNKKFIICNDPFGNFALYYYTNNSTFIFSTQIHSLTEIIKTKDFNDNGFYQYLGLGFTLNGKTYYDKINKLQAGEILTYNKGNAQIKKYYEFVHKRNKSKRIYFDIIKNSFISGIKKCIENNEKVGAAISGGYDSRVTWGIINYLNEKDNVIAFTHGLENSRDIQIAKRIANKLNLNHKTKIFNLDFINSIPNSWELFTKLTEGLSLITGAHAIDSWKFGSQYYKVLIDSHGGVLYRRQFMKVAEHRLKNSDYFSKHFFNLMKTATLSLNIINPELIRLIINASIEGLNKFFNLYNKKMLIGDKIDSFYLDQISGNRYSTASNAQMNWVILAHPFLNIAAIDALKNISIGDRSNQNIYKYIVNKTSPIMKTFYLANMGMPAPYYGFSYLRYAAMLYELLLQKIVGSLSVTQYRKLSTRRFVTNYDIFFRINFKVIKDILLRPNTKFYEIVLREQLENMINTAEKNEKINISNWAHLITIKLFFDTFH